MYFDNYLIIFHFNKCLEVKIIILDFRIGFKLFLKTLLFQEGAPRGRAIIWTVINKKDRNYSGGDHATIS